VGNLLQVMSLMAVPVLILGTIGYLNRRANRRPIEGARRHGDAPVPVLGRTPATRTDAGRPVSAVTPSSAALQRR
jgi:hypothetical protein